MLSRIFRFYRDGFKAMTLGRSLWKIIIVKLLIIFVIIRVFILPDFLQSNFDTDDQRAEHVLQEFFSH
ncbi:MAG: DUF4492 domain-containing protein [Candidatus Marinimicrobia bacterium]|nr:DUF4492 domain-containing protein [Candidatus Neomarinimicrobiota bacterium]